MQEACEGARDRGAAVADFLEPLVDRLAISRRYVDNIRRIVAVMPRLVTGRPGRFARTDMFDAAVEVTYADLVARRKPTEVLERYRASSHPGHVASRSNDGPPPPRRAHHRRAGG
jgi:poly(A) polymerase